MHFPLPFFLFYFIIFFIFITAWFEQKGHWADLDQEEFLPISSKYK